MSKHLVVAFYIAAMVATIIGVDFLFFRNRIWERLLVNVAIVLVFATFYVIFLRRP